MKRDSWITLLKNQYYAIKKYAASVGIIALITILLSGCYLFPDVKEVDAPELIEPEKIVYNTVAVKKGQISKAVEITSYFLPISRTDVAFRYGGMTFDEIYVRPGDYVTEGTLLAAANTDKIMENIESKELEIRKAEIDYSKLNLIGANQYQLESAIMDLELLYLQLENYKKDLEKTKLYAPVSGKVIFVNRIIKKGDSIGVNKTMVSIVNNNDVKLEYVLNVALERDRLLEQNVRLGTKVKVIINSREYEGQVVMTPYQAAGRTDLLSDNIIWIDVINYDQEIVMGSFAKIVFTLDKRDDVIVLSKDLIQKFGNTYYVRVLENGQKVEKTITLGLENETSAEITQGLKEGDKIILK